MNTRILVVEDDQAMLEALVDCLEDLEDVEVEGAGSVEKALQRADTFSPDVVITDVRLPGRDGIEALAALRERHPDCRGVVITGYASQTAPSRAVEQKAWEYLHKPFSLDQLVACVQRLRRAGEAHDRVDALSERLVNGFSRRLQQEFVPELNQKRLEAFRAFYVGVRAQALGRNEAFHLWTQLEELDFDLLQAAGAQDFERLAEGWSNVHEVVANFTYLGGLSCLQTSPQPGGASPEEFGRLYERLRSGEIPGHLELTLAPVVRQLEPAARSADPDYQRLYASFWL